MKKSAFNFIYFLIIAILFIGCSQKEDAEKPTASFKLSNNPVFVGDEVTVQNTSVDAEYYSWDFGDGTTYPVESPAHTYNTKGEYTVTLRAISKGMEDTFSEVIFVIEPEQGVITISTKNPLNITPTSAKTGGNIANQSSETIVQKGIVWSKNQNPTLQNNLGNIEAGDGNEDFDVQINGLEESTKYYVVAYATTNSGTVYAEQKSFTTTKENSDVYYQKNISINYTNSAPLIDGEIDEVWANADANVVDRLLEGSSVSYVNDPTFKVMWDNNYIYVLVNVPDDDYYPFSEANVEAWNADRVEIMFDANANLIDGSGPANPGSGHYQATADHDSPVWAGRPDFTGGELNLFAIRVDDAQKGYIIEYAISFDELVDGLGVQLNPYERKTIGFDVGISDLDENEKGGNTSKGMVTWCNNIVNNWDNMDNAGTITFQGGGNSSGELVIFDPATYDPAGLPDGMKIVDIEGNKYLEVTTNNWGYGFDIPVVRNLNGKTVSAETMFELGENSINKGYSLWDMQYCVQLEDTDNLIDVEWMTEKVPAFIQLGEQTASGNMDTQSAVVEEPMDNVHRFVFFAQYKQETTNATVGDIMWIGKIVVQ